MTSLVALSGRFRLVIDMNSNDVVSLYTQHPPREYHQAFDFAAKWLNENGGKKLCVISSIHYAVELLKRFPGELELIGANGFDVADFISASNGWNWGNLKPGSISDSKPRYEIIIWAVPEGSQMNQISSQLIQSALPGTSLIVIASGLLHRFIPGLGTYRDHNLHPFSLVRTLMRTGWHVDSTMGIHGLNSVAWGTIYRMCAAFGRYDWADKSLFVIRENYLVLGLFWWLSPLTIICGTAI